MKTNDLNIQIDALFKHWLISSNRNDKIIVENFIFILENNLIKLNKVERDSFFNIYIFNEFYSNDRKIIINLLKKLNNFFEIIKINKNEILIFFENRLFKIYFKKKFPKKIISIKSYFIFFYKIKYLYSPNYILSYLNIYLSRIINKNKTYLLTYNDFLKLNMFDKGISYNLRVKNMNLINNKGKIIYIKDILNFFKNKNKQKKISKVFFNKDLFYKSLNSNIPTYINLNYWRSSNFYLISNIIYGFFQKGFQYETQTLKNNFYKTFSSKINLIKDIDKINKLVTSSDLIIINNNPYSSRNRLLAMIGHILNGGEYINFKYKKYFDQSIFKQRLINLFAEHFSIYKYICDFGNVMLLS